MSAPAMQFGAPRSGSCIYITPRLTKGLMQAKENADNLMQQVKDIKEKAVGIDADRVRLEGERDDVICRIGNLVHASVPVHDNEVRA
jgi:seryl-tRNA synthetase